MKISHESVLAQMGHHRTPIDDIANGLEVFKSKSKPKRLFRMLKLAWVMIDLLWKGVIDGDDGDYWINF